MTQHIPVSKDTVIDAPQYRHSDVIYDKYGSESPTTMNNAPLVLDPHVCTCTDKTPMEKARCSILNTGGDDEYGVILKSGSNFPFV